MIFKSMGREMNSSRMFDPPRMKCERCKGWVYAGDWPFCRGSVQDHKR